MIKCKLDAGEYKPEKAHDNDAGLGIQTPKVEKDERNGKYRVCEGEETQLCPSCGTRYEIDYDDYDPCPNCGLWIGWN